MKPVTLLVLKALVLILRMLWHQCQDANMKREAMALVNEIQMEVNRAA